MQPQEPQPPQQGWQFKPEDSPQANGDFFEAQKVPYQHPAQTTQNEAMVSWSASEYIAHEKTPVWYLGLTTSVVLLTGAIYLITHSLFSAFIVLLLGIAVWVYGARQPQVLDYSIGQSGLDIGPKHYPYESFRSFAIVQDSGLTNIVLMPLKRLMPIMTIYFAPDDGQKIVDVLGQYLPQEDRDPDMIDRLARRFRF